MLEHVDISTNLVGHTLRMPVILASIGSMQDFVEGAGVAPTIAASEFGILHMISSTCMPVAKSC